MIAKLTTIIATVLLISACTTNVNIQSSEQLLRLDYISQINDQQRDYFVYLPKGYHSQKDKNWPVMLFLHGNGERGNGKDELDFVLSHGPLYEAWIQKKDLPFIIISPQLHMFGRDKLGLSYIDNRSKSDIPQKLLEGKPKRPHRFTTQGEMTGEAGIKNMDEIPPLLPFGWEEVELDLLAMLDKVAQLYRTDINKVYLTGLSYGGFGTWYLAHKYPDKFAAIVPVVGWGHPSMMKSIAQHKIPIWVFAGGRDTAVPVQYFYNGLNILEAMGHKDVRFTVHEDMGHDTWTRIYQGDDVYQWMLGKSL